jgi:hypothetical protein
VGTSKGYIAPTKPEWSNAKRAVSAYLRDRDSESKSKAIQRFAEAMNSSGRTAFQPFSSAAGRILSFAQSASKHGLDGALSSFDRDDLIGKDPKYILGELINQFTNNAATMDDSLSADALSQAFDNLNVETIDDLKSIDLDILLREMVTEFININFDLRFEEKIGRGRTANEKDSIVEEMHEYIADVIHDALTQHELGKIDLNNLNASTIVIDTLNDAFTMCANYYGEAKE